MCREAEHLERTEKTLQTLQEDHQELQDAHRAMGVEVDNLREDVMRMDDQLNRETGLRKSLQEEKKTLMAQAERAFKYAVEYVQMYSQYYSIYMIYMR